MKFKVGDKIIITKDHCELRENQVFTTDEIDFCDPDQPYRVLNKYSGRISWPHSDKIASLISHINEQKLKAKLGL